MLPVLGKKAVLEWCMKEDLIGSSYVCPKCGKSMELRERTGKKVVTLIAASVKLTYSASMVDRLTDFCLKVRHEIGVSSIKVMNPPNDTRSSLFVAKSESE
ncbi:hypothetical protein TNCV_1362131 [Trichonephila clavipes]|nr:hypothetical protein TNCV_1362131 [Trichonephila clavipes]